jgi:hypothetical protein
MCKHLHVMAQISAHAILSSGSSKSIFPQQNLASIETTTRHKNYAAAQLAKG